jgi:hypothetical protein
MMAYLEVDDDDHGDDIHIGVFYFVKYNFGFIKIIIYDYLSLFVIITALFENYMKQMWCGLLYAGNSILYCVLIN